MAERDSLPRLSGPDGACSDPFCSYRAELEFASDGCRAHGCQAGRYRHALETLMEFGKRLMGAETMEERGIGACICESARVIESA